MLVLLLFCLLITIAATSLAYRLSPAAKLKRRIQEALSPFERLDGEMRDLRHNVQFEIGLLASQYIQGVHAARLKAVPLYELKKYATGMRLQALKDVGIRTVADLQGWNEYRVSQVRGVGPKSASAVVQAAANLTVAARSAPINHPSLPFAADVERQIMQALYRQRWFDKHISEQGNALATILTVHQCSRDAILAKITFRRWLWKLGANQTIRRSLDQATALIGALQEPNFRRMKDTLSTCLNECRSIWANRVAVETIISDFNENRDFYDSQLTLRLGKPNGSTSTRPAPEPTEPNAWAASGVVHVEFGRAVPGPPPRPLGGGRTDPTWPSVQTQKSERLVSVGIGPTRGHDPTEFALPAAPRPAESKDLRWITRGEPIQIQDHTLPHGFVYVGKGINFEQYYAINPWLSAKPGGPASSDTAGFFFSYSVLSPEKRSHYLDWLADGASTSTEPGFGMLYFYGIERRVLDLVQGRVSNPPQDELDRLLQEAHRLGDLFSDKPGSVTQCCLRLADFAAACAFDGVSFPELPKSRVRTYELPLMMRFGIGYFMREGRPIPMEWALRWAYVEPTIYLRTPATRCPQEFEAAFAFVYREKFGDGLIVPANKTKLKLTYQPGWPTHPEPEIKHECSGIPDIAALSGPQQTLKGLVEEGTTAIDGYSRYLGRNRAKEGTLEALLNLPLCFWPSSARERWQAFCTSIVNPIRPVTLESLLREIGCLGDPAFAKISEIAANLNRALVGFEPDVLAGACRPKPSEMIVLFPLASECTPDRAIAEYRKASLIVSLSACIALADGHASEDEAAAVAAMIASWQHLHADLRSRLRAQYQLQVRQGIRLASVKSRFASLTPDGRMQMAVALSSLARLDGKIAATEVKLLEQVYRALELSPQLLYRHLHSGSQSAQGLALQAHSASLGTSDYAVDAVRLAALRQETDHVSALLAEVFVEEESPSSAPNRVASPVSLPETFPEDRSLPGLDPNHQRFLAEILSRPSWTRSELKATAARMQIMLDGALERINEAAFDLIGEPITEGDDPVYVHQNVLENAE